MKSPTRILSIGLLLVGAGLCQPASAAFNSGKLFIDFGMSSGDGAIMVSPDTNGNYWNNAILNSRPSGGTKPADVINLVTSTNLATGVNITFASNWQANGNDNGGLLSPNPTLLGDFAQINATRDYMFLNSSDSGSSTWMTFTGLNPELTYDFQIFATRQQTEVRTSRYSITDINGTHIQTLQTSGPGIGAGGYNGNNDTFAYLSGIVPNAAGEITLTLSAAASPFAYIGAMSITAVPEPDQVALIALGGLVLIVARRYQLRRRATV